MSRLDRRVSLGPGKILGGYQLLIPVGTGGMGQVWAARRLASPQSDVVAVKVALADPSADPEFERIFVDEANIASQIVHPNVCAVREFGTDQGVAYLVMEWVHGGTLHDILAANPTRRIDCYLAARIAICACSGLHAVHELHDLDGNPLHVVHRDVSPQNILISTDGRVSIADFGIARAKGQLHTPTRTGELKGKLSYMAPEQLTSKQFDRRADVFALGCVLYEATLGQRPFHGDDTLETMYKLLETECPRPSALVADYPTRLESIVLTALARDTSSRYQSAKELGDELLRFLAARGKLSTEVEISELVKTSLHDKLQLQAQQLDTALEATVRSSSPPLGAPATAAPSRSFQPSTYWSGLGIVALLLTATGVLLSNRNHELANQPQNTVTSAVVGAIPTATVQIDIVTEPPRGWLRVDASAAVPSPWHLDIAPSRDPHVVVAGMSDYEERREVIAFDHTSRYVIRLQPTKAEPTHTGIKARTPARIDTTPLSTPTATSRLLEWLPPRLRKPKRSLDPDNPF